MKPTNFLTCQQSPANQLPSDFIANQKAIYHKYLQQYNINVRLATMDDREAIIRLRNERFQMPNTYSSHWLYQLFNFGSCILLETKAQKLIGYKFESTYATHNGIISFTGGTAIAQSHTNLGLGKLIIGYSHLIAMEKGATVNKGIINIKNYTSVANFINHFGGIFTEFEIDFKNYGPRLFYSIPLDELTPYRQLNLPAIYDFLQIHQPNKDYHLIETTDTKKLQSIYSTTNHRIIALLKKDFFKTAKELYLAIPIKHQKS